MAAAQDQAILDYYCCGQAPEVPCYDDSSYSDEEVASASRSDENIPCTDISVLPRPDEQWLLTLLCESKYNWFEFIERIESQSCYGSEDLEEFFDTLAQTSQPELPDQ